MGYYTRFDLHLFDAHTGQPIEVDDDIEFRVGLAFKKVSEYIGDDLGWSRRHYSLFDGESTKWYGHEEDLKAASEYLPEYVLALHGDGEEQGDLWVKYAHKGRIYEERAEKWVPPPPDMKKLGAA